MIRLSATALCCCCLLGLGAALAPPAAAQQVNSPRLGRSIHGVVMDARNRPLPAAIVYLVNRKTKAIHTVITDDQGVYSFHQLVPNTGYDVYAEWRHLKSPTRSDSQYETANDIELDLKIPVQ